MSSRKRALKITWREAWPIWLVFAILIGFGALGVWVLSPAAQVPAKALAQGEDATVKMADLQPNMPSLFAYPLPSGRTVEAFVERGAGNKVTAAFASCRRCYRAGHFRRDGQIMCGQCNEPMVKATEGQAPPADKDCTQIPIPFELSGDRVTVRAVAVAETFDHWYTPVIAASTNGGGR